MSDNCKGCSHDIGAWYCGDIPGCKFGQAHKPAVNESGSPSRTRGSLPAAPGQSEVEAAASQLARVLCPPDPVLYDKPCGACTKCNPIMANVNVAIMAFALEML